MKADKCFHCRIIVKAFDEQICIDTLAGTEKGLGTNVLRMQPRNVGCKQGSPRNKENLPTLLPLPLRFSPNTEKTHAPFFFSKNFPPSTPSPTLLSYRLHRYCDWGHSDDLDNSLHGRSSAIFGCGRSASGGGEEGGGQHPVWFDLEPTASASGRSLLMKKLGVSL